MTKTLVVAGYGPGISNAVAERFGAAGFSLAIVARDADRLALATAALAAKGIRAQAFPTNLADVVATRDMISAVRAELGPISAIHWNAYGSGGGDLTTTDDSGLQNVLAVAVNSLVAAIQAALPDLREQRGAVLITNGGLGFFDPDVDAIGVQWNAMGLSIANSAKHKAARLLAIKLAPEIYVGEVVVTGAVKGTAFDHGNATLEPATIAERFWDLHEARSPASVIVG
ncbi:MAG: SDR family NAD(P)-dependent oxidoreductase [Kofleriaceae bacterium]